MAYLYARNLEELLSLTGEAFVGACYVTLLGRDPDTEGLAFHLRPLSNGADRLEIIEMLLSSEEGRTYGSKMAGLAEALIKAKIGRHATAIEAIGLQHEMAALLGFLDLIPPLDPGDRAAGTSVGSLAAEGQPRGASVVVVRPRKAQTPAAGTSVWYDLSDLLQRGDQPRARRRAELELVRLFRRALPGLRFLVQVGNDLLEVGDSEIAWLFDETFMADAFVAAYVVNGGPAARSVTAWLPESTSRRHPCGHGDTLLGWASVGKKTDSILTREGKEKVDVRLCHILSEADIAAGAVGSVSDNRAKRYFAWLSSRSALTIFTSEKARSSMAALQKREQWSSPPQTTLDGLGFIPRLNDGAAEPIVAELGIDKPFALYSGALGPGNNLETLYRAWVFAKELDPANIPRLVMCGSSGEDRGDLIESMTVDPRLAGDLFLLRPTDRELSALFAEAAFVVSPGLGDGAIDTLLEVLNQGKACIAADTGTGRQPANKLITYVHAIDVRAWANAIIRHGSDGALIARPPSDAGKTGSVPSEDPIALIKNGLARSAADASIATRTVVAAQIIKPTIWMDLTLTFLEWGGHITGIVRAELTFAYYLKKLAPDTRYFAHVRGNPGYFFEIDAPYLSWLFDAVDLSDSYRMFNAFWKDREAAGTGHRNPFHKVGGPVADHPAYLRSFPANAVVFFAAIDQDGTGKLGRCREVLDIVHDEQASMTSQLVYDLTPFLMPQVHHEFTVRGYTPFVEFVSDHFDHLLFGGRTSQRDCRRIQQEAGWGSPPSDFVEFGSDIALAGETALPPLERKRSIEREKAILEQLGITGAFVITVGSLEPRKNHEVLYKAYLELLERGSLTDDLQMVFIGKRGWKIDDLLATIAADERVRGKLLILSPDDEGLEALYFQCRFTLLPSFYEGWSLTLPESLSYGKFCLVSDVDPLRETGGDLVEYVHPLDTMAWADRIEHYVNNPDDVAKWEAKIRRGWHPRTWRESTQMLIERLHAAHADRYPY